MHVPLKKPNNLGRAIVVLLVTTLLAANSGAYSVLTHQELIDLAWNSSIRPLLLAKFPGATDKQLKDAHAYAYGGSAVQDMGYYPFGKLFFSNLTHYVRSGDFVMWMLRNARTIDEYAFAIGALSHYLGDSIGHSEAINPATAIEFPKLEKKFGDKVTYGESPHGHVRTEFAFDVDELRDAAFAPPAYLEFIGFKVPRRFLERAFVATYGFDIREVLGKSRPSFRSYRTVVRSFIPAFAEAEVVLHGNAFPPHPDDEAYRIFSERVAQTNYERHWKHANKGPGVKAHLLAIFVFLVPKVGGASDLAMKIPDHQTQEWYLQSVNHTVDVFRDTLHKALEEGVNDPVALANVDLDTGRQTKAGDYPLADEAYAQLLGHLISKPTRVISESVKRHMLDHYEAVGMSGDDRGQISSELATLEKMKARGSGE